MNATFNAIVPRRAQHAALYGMTGSGKTELVKQFLKMRRYVVIYDAKGMIQLDGFARVTTLAECIKSKAERIIYAPNHYELDIDDPAMFARLNDFFKWVYETKNRTIYIDEVYSIVKGRTFPHYYRALLTRGREMGISVISATQRPKDIPQVMMSESHHHYVFKLMLTQDRERIEDVLGLSVEKTQKLRGHSFYYVSVESGAIMGPLQLEL